MWNMAFMTCAIIKTSSDAVKSTLSLSLSCSCIKKEPKAQPGMLRHLQVTHTPWQKLLEVQDNKGFKNPTHLLLRRKTGCFSKPVLLWDIYSPGHKQTFCQVKSGLIAWDHFPPTSQGQAIWLWVPLAHSNKSLRAPTKTFSYCWCRRGVRRNISPVSG